MFGHVKDVLSAVATHLALFSVLVVTVMQLVVSHVFIMVLMHTFTLTFILELLEYRHFIFFIFLVVVAKSFIL